MEGKQVTGDGIPPSLTGMSKSQLYDIMSQMKTLIEQNKQQARQILIQNPVLTRALFQAQIMLGMVQSSQASPAISSTASQIPNPKPSSAISNQPSKIQPAPSFPSQTDQTQMRKQTPNQNPNQTLVSKPHSQPIPPNPQPQPTPSRPLQPLQQPKPHQSAPMSIPQSSQVPNLTQLPQHTVSRPPSPHQSSMPSLSRQSQQPMQSSGNQYLPQQQPQPPPLPPQPRPPMSGFPHQGHAQMGPSLGFQHPSGPQMHHSQHMFHSGGKHPGGMGPSFPQGQLPHPNQPLPPSLYQGGSPHLGMDFNQTGNSRQTDRGGSNWTPGPHESTIGQLQGPPPFPSHVGPSSQPPRPASLTPELEKTLLQQVMSLTPEQINMLPPEQRSQVLQLQQMLRQ